MEEMCNSNESTIVSIAVIEAFLNRSESAFQSSHLCSQQGEYYLIQHELHLAFNHSE